MKRLLDHIFSNILDCKFRYFEGILASMAIWWGAWLLAPWETFTTGPAYIVARSLAPEEVWGAALLIAGIVLMASLWKQSFYWRRRALLTLSMIWLAVWLAFLFGNWRGTATAVYIHHSLLCGFAYLRLGYRGP